MNKVTKDPVPLVTKCLMIGVGIPVLAVIFVGLSPFLAIGWVINKAWPGASDFFLSRDR